MLDDPAAPAATTAFCVAGPAVPVTPCAAVLIAAGKEPVMPERVNRGE